VNWKCGNPTLILKYIPTTVVYIFMSMTSVVGCFIPIAPNWSMGHPWNATCLEWDSRRRSQHSGERRQFHALDRSATVIYTTSIQRIYNTITIKCAVRTISYIQKFHAVSRFVDYANLPACPPWKGLLVPGEWSRLQLLIWFDCCPPTRSWFELFKSWYFWASLTRTRWKINIGSTCLVWGRCELEMHQTVDYISRLCSVFRSNTF
jgi:hypothetical protein